MSISKKIVDKLINNEIISCEEREVYEYCAKSLLQFVGYICCLTLMGIMMHKIFETIAFIIFFLGIRGFAGGYHAKKEILCSIMSIAVYILYLWFCECITVLSNTNIIILIVFFVINICVLAPVDCKNKRLIKKEYYRNKIFTIIFTCLFVIIGILFRIENVNIIGAIMLTEVISLYMGVIDNMT